MSLLVHPYISKNGTATFIVTDPGNTTQGLPTSIPSNPTVYQNGSAVTLDGPSWSYYAGNIHYGIVPNTPISPSDVFTYSWASGGIVTSNYGSSSAATNAAMVNDFGQLEQTFAEVKNSPFTPTRGMGVGMNMGQAAFVPSMGYSPSKNLCKRMGLAWTDSSGATPFTVSADGFPQTMNAGGTLKNSIWNGNIPNGINALGMPVPIGRWTIKFTDTNANTANALIAYLYGDPNVGNGFEVGFPARTVVGNVVTLTQDITYAGNGATYGYNLAFSLYIRSPLGNVGAGGVISNFWVFGPDDVDADTSDPLATSLTVRNWLTDPATGKGPACLRPIEQLNGIGGVINYQDYADVQAGSNFSWGVVRKLAIQIAAIRPWNTNPAKDNVGGDGTYPWAATPKFYHPIMPGTGSDSLGSFIDLSTVGGSTDMGAVLNGNPQNPNFWTACEFRTVGAHGLRSGDMVYLNGGNSIPLTQPYIIPIATGDKSTLGTASVTNGSQTITFSSSVTIPSAQAITVSGDTTKQAYRIQVGGTGTTFTLDPQYQGTTNAAATINNTAYVNLNGFQNIVWVTSATTFVASVGASNGGTGSPIQTIYGTAEIPLGWYIEPWPKGAVGSYGFYARQSAYWAGTKLWVPMQPHMSAACINAIIDEMAPLMRNGSELIIEMGLEPWNSGQGAAGFGTFIFNGIFGQLLKYVPAGTVVTSKYNSAGTAQIDYYAYVILANRIHEIAQARLNANWAAKNITIGRHFGSFISGSGVTASIISTACTLGAGANGLQSKIPVEYVSVAPYTGWGSQFSTQNPKWINDAGRHQMKYSTLPWSDYSAHYAQLQLYTGPTGLLGQINGKPALVGYEGGPNQVAQGQSIGTVHDCWFHPSMGDAWDSVYQSYQDGDPRVPGSGLAFLCEYHLGGLYGGSQQMMFAVAIRAGDPGGDGSTNKYTTAAAGSPGDGADYTYPNNSVVLPRVQKWFGAYGPGGGGGGGGPAQAALLIN